MRRTLALCLALLLPCVGDAQGFKDLKLTVTAEKSQIVPGEPVVLCIKVTNSTAQAITAHHDLTPRYGMLDVSIASKGKSGRYMGSGWGTFSSRPQAKAIAPGQELVHEVTIHRRLAMFDREDLLPGPTTLDEPGVYQISVTWSQLGFAERLTARPMEIRVASATGADLALWNAMRADAEIGTVLSRGSGSGAIVSKIEKLVAQHGTAAQAGHLALVLGKSYVNSGDPTKAIPHLIAAAQARPKSALRREAVLTLVNAYGRTKALDKAKETLSAAAADFEGSPQWATFEQMRQELAKGAGTF